MNKISPQFNPWDDDRIRFVDDPRSIDMALRQDDPDLVYGLVKLPQGYQQNTQFKKEMAILTGVCGTLSDQNPRATGNFVEKPFLQKGPVVWAHQAIPIYILIDNGTIPPHGNLPQTPKSSTPTGNGPPRSPFEGAGDSGRRNGNYGERPR